MVLKLTLEEYID